MLPMTFCELVKALAVGIVSEPRVHTNPLTALPQQGKAFYYTFV